MVYNIKKDYIPRFGKSRSGKKLSKVRFIVAHDTGNSGSTAQGNVNWFKGNPIYASAHAFIDDVDIIENVPLGEKAWHVIYNVTTDNIRFGDDANDSAIGVELCYGGRINFEKAYKKYVWYLAYLCKKFDLVPKKHIVGHSALDPRRKTDPENALHKNGKSFGQLIKDVTKEMKGDPMADGYLEQGESGKAVAGVQAKLIQLGYDLGGYGADGSFGPATKEAVIKFQENEEIEVDGLVGPETLDTLDKAIARQRQEKTHFADVPEDAYYADAVKWAKENEIVFGYGDTDGKEFGVGDYMKREDVIVVLRRAFMNLK